MVLFLLSISWSFVLFGTTNGWFSHKLGSLFVLYDDDLDFDKQLKNFPLSLSLLVFYAER